MKFLQGFHNSSEFSYTKYKNAGIPETKQLTVQHEKNQVNSAREFLEDWNWKDYPEYITGIPLPQIHRKPIQSCPKSERSCYSNREHNRKDALVSKNYQRIQTTIWDIIKSMENEVSFSK